eukprot:gnl/TRDRNA2_/TRDRNA2_164692_c0_seq1.p1 gnl/TRDRNA2_/TRDRNA2_164692_c0~~gnl/TRDRNA2_/TRDRNA2_164692_c0_seq1.p1  ORF type:complete len:306 (+),score=48.66 gnl/TRDRNA2_/TRDRNA2_164692_c0_seq1:114-920(+)
MTPAEEKGLWETQMRVGESGQEEFHIIRDRDDDQIIYPLETSTHTDTPIMGPDAAGKGRYFRFRGPPREVVNIQFHLSGGNISVTVVSKTKGEKIWTNSGDHAIKFYVTGTFNNWGLNEMTQDGTKPGLHRCLITMGEKCKKQVAPGLFVGENEFHIVVNRNRKLRYYPAINGSPCTKGKIGAVLQGPDNPSEDKHWLMTGDWEAPMELTFEPLAEDRRAAVLYQVSEPSGATMALCHGDGLGSAIWARADSKLTGTSQTIMPFAERK